MQEANQDFLTSLEGKTLAECINLICDKASYMNNCKDIIQNNVNIITKE